ncbi:MAG: hypothetical protein C4589_10420 [Peptococcaceae bacterium]|nr:MAG: hypothetical protein C4589_10420 [Peptococcaceae bacterium]
MFGFSFSRIKNGCRWPWAGVLIVAVGVTFVFIAFVTPAYALGLDLGVAKVGLNESGLKVSAGEGTVSATVGSGGLAVDLEEGVAAAGGVGLGEATVTTGTLKTSSGESPPAAEHLAEGVTVPLAGSDNRGKDVLIDPFRDSGAGENEVIDGAPKTPSPLVELGGVLADAGDLTRGLVSAVINDPAVTGPTVPVVSPLADVTGGVLEPAGKLINGTVATLAKTPVAGPVVEKTVDATTDVVGAGLDLVGNVTGDVLVPLADQVLDLPSTLLTPVLGTVDELLETDLTQTVQSLLMFVSDKGKGVIGTVDGLLPVVNEILEPVGIDTGSNYARDGPGEWLYNPTFLPGEETDSSSISSSGVNIAPEAGSSGQFTFNNRQSASQGEGHLPYRNRFSPNAIGFSPLSGMNVNAGSGTGAGGNYAAVSSSIFKLDRLPLNGAITEFLDPERLPPFISLFSPPG